MIRPKKETVVLLLSIIENCETLIEVTHTKPQKKHLNIKTPNEEKLFHLNYLQILVLTQKG